MSQTVEEAKVILVNKNLSEMPLGESVTAAGFEIVFKSNRFFF